MKPGLAIIVGVLLIEAGGAVVIGVIDHYAPDAVPAVIAAITTMMGGVLIIASGADRRHRFSTPGVRDPRENTSQTEIRATVARK